jgi:hypothetical protein
MMTTRTAADLSLMAKTKATKREPSKAPASRRWRITLLKATPAKFIGYVRAPDAKSAIEMATKDYKTATGSSIGSSPRRKRSDHARRFGRLRALRASVLEKAIRPWVRPV